MSIASFVVGVVSSLSLSTLVVLSLAALAGYLLALFLAYEYRCRVSAIPGCIPPPRTKSLASRYLAADTLQALRDPRVLRERDHDELGDVYSSVFFFQEYVSVRGFKNVRFLLNGEHDAVEVSWPLQVRKLLGPRSISTIYYDSHKALRKTMAPALGPRAVSAMVPVVAEICSRRFAKWAEESSSSCSGDGDDENKKKVLSGVHECKSLTFEVALDVILGFDTTKMTPKRYERAHEDFDTWLNGFAPGASELHPRGKLRLALKARQNLLSLIDELLCPMIEERRKARKEEKEAEKEGKEASPSATTVMARLVDAALDEEESSSSPSSSSSSALSLDHETLLDVGLNLLFAGHDTSATTLCLLMRELASSSERASGDDDLLRRLRDEQHRVVAEHGEQVTSESLAAAPLASACVREMLRLRPIVPQLFRKAQRDFVLDGGGSRGGGEKGSSTDNKRKVAVRAGSLLVLDVADTLAKDERWAGEPESSKLHPSRFAPERWLGADGDGGDDGDDDATKDSSPPSAPRLQLKRSGGAHIPFGGGPRMCAGYVLATAELETALALLCRGFEWEVLNPKAPLLGPPMLPLPSDGMEMRVRMLSGASARKEGEKKKEE